VGALGSLRVPEEPGRPSGSPGELGGALRSSFGEVQKSRPFFRAPGPFFYKFFYYFSFFFIKIL